MNNASQTPVYQVLIIGNGPSGISLSNMLSGNIPYYSGKVPNGGIKSEGISIFDKCMINPDLSIIDQDLAYLSEGLQGRSENPVALLFDHLNQPNADTGQYQESTLVWVRHAERKINHLVVGRGRFGGSWHQMQGAQLTVSLNNWLDLPGWSYLDWLKVHRQRLKESAVSCKLAHNDVYSEGQQYDRASTSHVAEYYETYVNNMGMEKNFDSNVKVTSVRRADDGEKRWEVCCERKVKFRQFGSRKKSFRVYAENVVLATGLSKPKRLGIEGESLPFVHHHLRKVVEFSKRAGRDTVDPVVIVGDGLCAADAVLELSSLQVPIVHILRHDLNDEELILNKLPTQMYHDYAKVKDMMAKPVYDGEGRCMYHAFPKCQLLAISKHKECKIKLADGKSHVQHISAVFILIGSKPDLGFLKDAPGLGVNPAAEVDCRHNPIDVDPFTYECRRVKNLFAMGPLVGDNFVRFGIGGALGIVSHLHKHYKR